MKNIYTLFLGIFIFLNTSSQPIIEWQKTIGGGGHDLPLFIQQTNDGGYILGGSSASNISGDKSEDSNGIYDYWIVKTDVFGNIQWQNTIGGNNSDQLKTIKQTNDGGYILGGYSNSNISGDKTENSKGGYDYWILKTNSVGVIQWQKTIGGSSDDRLSSLMQTIDGGYVLAGYSLSNISGDKTENSRGSIDYWVIKINNLGSIQWQKTIGGDSFDKLYSILQTSDGGYILGGTSNSNISGDKTENTIGSLQRDDYWVIKLSSLGNIQWQKTIGGSDSDLLNYIEQTDDGGYILGGSSASDISGYKTENSKGAMDYWVVKIDSIGNLQMQKTIGGNSNDAIVSIQKSPNGGYFLGGISDSNISGDKSENCNGLEDYWVIKVDSLFIIEWQKTIGGSSTDELFSFQPTTDGGYILGGYSASDISGDKTENSKGGFDYWIIKLSAYTSVSETILLVDFNLFPNPSTEEVNISFALKEEREIKIKLYNSLGQIVKTISKEKYTSGENKHGFSTENLLKGVYHIKFFVDEYVVTKKLIKM